MQISVVQAPNFVQLSVGETVASGSCTLTRDMLVRYAGASGDFNPIHYRDDVARSVGLEGVLAHGMLTMGIATSVASEWLGGAGVILDAQARFSRPVFVDAQSGADVTVTVTVAALDPDTKQATLSLLTAHAGKTVLAKAQVQVQFN